MKLQSVHLPDQPPDTLWEVTTNDNTIQSITPFHAPTPSTTKALAAPLLLPSLCHPHIHLDKAYLLNSRPALPPSSPPQDSSNQPSYSDLVPQSNTFQEALTLTSRAKTRYTTSDLRLRGSQLIISSVKAGVSSMRAFVEIDRVTETKCLDVAVELKRAFKRVCQVQICAFAQDPVWSGDVGDQNRGLMEDALLQYTSSTNTSTTPTTLKSGSSNEAAIEVLGSTPYVEDSLENSKKNVEWAITNALKHNLHLDFHLDYNLDEKKEPLVWYVIDALQRFGWPTRSSSASPTASETRRNAKTVVLGHCMRLALFSRDEMQRLATKIHDSDLPISFVGLPTSDIFMMGRPPPPSPTSPPSSSAPWGSSLQPRGTLDLLSLSRPPYNLQTCLSVNNVGNAFTPWGSVDPLRLCSLMVGLCQDGRGGACEELLGMVSTKARACIGLDDAEDSGGEEGNREVDNKETRRPEEGERKSGQNEKRVGKTALLREGLRGPWLLVKNREWDEVKLPERSGSAVSEKSVGRSERGEPGAGIGSIKVPARNWCSVTDVV